MGSGESTASNVAGGRIRSLGMSLHDLASLLNHLDASEAEATSGSRAAKRQYKRRSHRVASLPVEITPRGGPSVRLLMVCRNLSSGGASLLHNSFLHAGTRLALTLRHLNRGSVTVHGKVAHCDHVRGMVHQVGVRFEQIVNIADYVKLDELSDWFTLEHVPLDEVRGCLVLGGASEVEQRLIQHCLEGTETRLRLAEGHEAAIGYVREGADLVLLDIDQGRVDLDSFFAAANESGLATPVIVVSGKSDAELKRVLREFQPSAVLAKPILRDLLLRSIAEFLVVGRSAAATVSSLITTDERYALVPGFVRSLHESAEDLQGLIARREADAARAICLQLAKAAPTVGFSGIGLLADQAARSLTQTRSVESSRPALQRLILACESAQAGRAA